jgi:hypothetical protein
MGRQARERPSFMPIEAQKRYDHYLKLARPTRIRALLPEITALLSMHQHNLGKSRPAAQNEELNTLLMRVLFQLEGRIQRIEMESPRLKQLMEKIQDMDHPMIFTRDPIMLWYLFERKLDETYAIARSIREDGDFFYDLILNKLPRSADKRNFKERLEDRLGAINEKFTGPMTAAMAEGDREKTIKLLQAQATEVATMQDSSPELILSREQTRQMLERFRKD